MMPRIPALLMVVVVSACDAGADDARWRGTVVDSAGVVTVENPTDGLWPESAVWTIREELRIGAFSGDPAYQFGRVGSIAVGSDGQLVVVDRQAPSIRVFDAEGTFQHEIGQLGSGPGELQPGVADAWVGPGDTLLVADVRNRRIHRFAPDGSFIDDAPIDVARHRPLRFRWNAATATAVVQLRPNGPAAASGEGDPGAAAGVGAEVEPRDELRVVRPDGSFGDVLMRLPSGGMFSAGEGITYFTPEPVWAVTDSLTVLSGVNDRYRIDAWARDGSLRRVLTMPYAPREITERDIGAFFAYLDAQWLALGVPPSRLPENRSRVAFAETFPAYYQFFPGPQGTLWVQPVRAPGEMTDEEIEHYDFVEDFGASEWEVFDGEGRFLGQVSMPPRFQPRLFVDDLIYGVVRDELDVHYVARMRIETGTSPD
jgi:hypothetical protein